MGVGEDAGFAARLPPFPGPSADASVWDGATHDLDGGLDPFVKGPWAPVPDPAHCPLRYSLDPSKAGLDWTWAPCPSGNPDCQSLVVDWAPPGRVLDFQEEAPVRWLQGRAYFSYRRWYSTDPNTSDYAAVDVVQDLASGPVFAVGGYSDEIDWCWISSLAIGDYGVGYLASVGKDHVFPFAGWAPWSDLTHLEGNSPAGRQPTAAPGSSGFTRMGATRLTSGGIIFDIATQSLLAPPRVCGEGIELGWPVPGGWISNGSDIRFIGDDGSIATLTSPHASRGQLALDRASADTVVWTQLEGATVTMWSSPFSKTAVGFAPRPIAANPLLEGHRLIVNAGTALLVADASTIFMTRLSDGWSWSIPFEPGIAAAAPVWVDDQNIWIGTRSSNGWVIGGLVRLSRSNLGAPTIPPGL